MNRKHAPAINNTNKAKKKANIAPDRLHKYTKGESTSVYLLKLSGEKQLAKRPIIWRWQKDLMGETDLLDFFRDFGRACICRSKNNNQKK